VSILNNELCVSLGAFTLQTVGHSRRVLNFEYDEGRTTGMLRHRPHASNVAVVSLLRNINGGETLTFKERKKKWNEVSFNMCIPNLNEPLYPFQCLESRCY
jgi:hypothetical protein